MVNQEDGTYQDLVQRVITRLEADGDNQHLINMLEEKRDGTSPGVKDKLKDLFSRDADRGKLSTDEDVRVIFKQEIENGEYTCLGCSTTEGVKLQYVESICESVMGYYIACDECNKYFNMPKDEKIDFVRKLFKKKVKK